MCRGVGCPAWEKGALGECEVAMDEGGGLCREPASCPMFLGLCGNVNGASKCSELERNVIRYVLQEGSC